ncbi:MAG: MFS transporter [Candidatus Nanopelagicales bacterium]
MREDLQPEEPRAEEPASQAASAARHWRDDLVLLRQRDLALLTASRFVSVTGTSIAPVAMAFGVLALPGATATSIGVVLFAGAVPQVLFMLLGGVAADRVRRSRLMVVSEMLAAMAQLAAGALFLTGSATVPLLAMLSAVSGVAVALFFPALTGIVPEVVPKEDLQSANALLRLASNVARILGSALGGLLVATVGAGWALVVDGASFVVSAALILLVRVSFPTVRAAVPSMLDDLRHGWHEFSSRRWVVSIVAVFAVGNIGFSSAIGVLGPVQADQSLGGAAPWAAIVAAYSLGTVLGVVVALRLRPARPMLVAMAVAPVLGLSVLALGPPAPLWALVGLAFLGGVSIDVFSVLWETALQQHIPGESLSRVSAYDWLGSSALTPFALAAVGPYVDAVGLEAAILTAGVLALVPGLALLDPQVRGLRAIGPAAGSATGRV